MTALPKENSCPTNFHILDACKLCGSREFDVLYREPFTEGQTWDFLNRYYEGRISKEDVCDGLYEVCECKQCQFIWQNHILNEEGINKLYEEWIDPEYSLKSRTQNNIVYYSKLANEAALISFLFNKKPPHEIKVLDFGMGWAVWPRMVNAFCYSCAGAELSQNRIDFAKQNNVRVVGDIFHTDETFDYIYADGVFEHLTEPVVIFERLSQMLNPGGFLHVDVPYGEWIAKNIRKGKWQPQKDEVHPLEHIFCYRHKNLVDLGKRFGLEPLPLTRLLPAMAKNLYHGTSNLSLTVRDPFYHQFGNKIRFVKKG